MAQKNEIDQDNIIEEVNTFIFNMPIEYSLGHCVAIDMRMSAGIAIYFKLLNYYSFLMSILTLIFLIYDYKILFQVHF